MDFSKVRANVVVSALVASGILALNSGLRAGETEERMALAATAFLGSLDADQREAATFDWEDSDRYDWHFIPKTRPGLALKDMTQAQAQLAMALLSLPMSKEGFVKASTVMSLEDVLHELENFNPIRDSRLYQFSVFGEPEEFENWGFRVEGHHLSLNFTILDGELASATPSFMGANPDIMLVGPRKGEQILSAEQELALELIESFSEEQNESAKFAEASPDDVITGGKSQAEALKPTGIAVADLDESQRELLFELIATYVYRHDYEWAEVELDRIIDSGSLTFAWAGTAEKRNPMYYRIQAHDTVIEYANTQNDANHSHATFRRIGNDFARDSLAHHYAEEHSDSE